MIFKEMTLMNFRQYRDEHTFSFPIEGEKNVSLIIARNGVGKTTFLQAFRFCFYGENQGALKLPKSDELITSSLEHTMSVGDKAPVMVTIKFEHAGRHFIARRKIVFQMGKHRLEKLTKPSDESFELLEEDKTLGIIKVENGTDKINEMMPIGLAHVYMFDGERVETPISSKAFQDGLQTSIVGVLGLEKLQQAYKFLGSTGERSTVIGKISAKLRTMSSSEQNILDREKILLEANEDKRKEISDKKRAIEKFDKDIEEGRAAQSSILEVKSASDRARVFERDVQLKQRDLDEMIRRANALGTQLLLKIQIAKLYEKYQVFVNSSEDTTEMYENLYKSVIDDILSRGICICGRDVEHDDKYAEHLKKLIALPQDNSVYLNNLNSLFKSLEDMPTMRNKMVKYNESIIQLQDELEELRKKQEDAERKVKEIEAKRGGEQSQINIEAVRQYKASAIHRIQELQQQIEKNDHELANTKSRLNSIKASNEHNIKVTNAIKMLETLRIEIGNELEDKKETARTTIEKNMNVILRQITDQRYADFQVELDKDYQLTVYKHVHNTDEYEDTTEVLSTGENVVMYLSFLRALVQTISETSEFDDISQNGVIMDAALSNLDEEHIKQISSKILPNFDQLIFLSYKGQLRNELISGINKNVSKVYELTKNENGDIETNELSVQNIENYVNEGDDD